MIIELAKLIPNYAGKESHIRCFLHILNLVAKTVIKLFDPPKGKTGEGGPNVSETEGLLEKLAAGIELEEEATRAAQNVDAAEDDDVETIGDDIELLSEEEKAELNEGIMPVRLAIVKASP